MIANMCKQLVIILQLSLVCTLLPMFLPGEAVLIANGISKSVLLSVFSTFKRNIYCYEWDNIGAR